MSIRCWRCCVKFPIVTSFGRCIWSQQSYLMACWTRLLNFSVALRHGSSVENWIKEKKNLKNQKLHIVNPDSLDSATTAFLITMRSHVIWRHNHRYFGGLLYCQSLDQKYRLKPHFYRLWKQPRLKQKWQRFWNYLSLVEKGSNYFYRNI